MVGTHQISISLLRRGLTYNYLLTCFFKLIPKSANIKEINSNNSQSILILFKNTQ